MISQIFIFIFSINLGGVTLGQIYASMFVISALFALMSYMIGNASISRFKTPERKDK